jgi:hypothetical protein
MQFLIPCSVCWALHTCSNDRTGPFGQRTAETAVKIFPKQARKVPGMIPLGPLRSSSLLVSWGSAAFWHGVCTSSREQIRGRERREL